MMPSAIVPATMPRCVPPPIPPSDVPPKNSSTATGITSVTRTFSPRRAASRSSSAVSAATERRTGAGRALMGRVLTRSPRCRDRPSAPGSDPRATSAPARSSSTSRPSRAAHCASSRTRSAEARPGSIANDEPTPAFDAACGMTPTGGWAVARRARSRASAASGGGAWRRKRSCDSPALTRAAGESTATIRPPCRIATRSARASTSARSWVVSRIVRPSPRSDPMSSRVSRRAAGSIPAVGSSRSSTSGSPTRASASERRCRSPPDRRRTRVPATSPRPTCSMSSSGRRPPVMERRVQPQEVSRRRPRLEARAALQHQPDPRPQRRAAAPRVLSQHPRRARVRVAIALDDLDRRRLAGAVRPEQGDDLAGPHDEVDAVENRAPAIRLAKPFDLDHGEAGASSVGAGCGPVEPPMSLAAGPTIAWNCLSNSACVSSPTWIERRIPSRSMKYDTGRATTR